MWMFFESCWEQRPTVGATALSPPLSLTTTHHHNTHWKQKNTVTMIPHDPPAPRGSNWIGKCNHRTSRNRSRWFRCGNVFYIDKTNLFFILLTIVLFASARRSRGQKVSFLCYFIVLLLFRWFDATRIDPSYPPILFFPRPPQYSSCFSLILDRGGGCAMCHGHW